MKRISLMGALVAALALVATGAAAQTTGAVRGKVVDDKGQALEGAKVEIEFQGGVTRVLKVTAGKKGEFTQVGIPPGQYKVTITKDGYQGTFLNLRIPMGEPTELGDIKLVSAKDAQKAAQAAKVDDLAGPFKAAFELMQAGKLDEAKAAYEALLAKHADVAEVYFNLGYIAAQKKDMAAAEAAYKKAIELKPDYGQAYTALAEVYQATEGVGKAIEYLSGVAAQMPEDGRVQYRLGAFYMSANKTAEAAAALEKAAQLDPENAEIFFQMGSVHLNQNNAAKAVESFEKYLSMNPTNAQNKATATALIAALKPKK